MIPMWLKIKIPRENSRPTTLWLPLIVVWLPLLLLLILCLPIWLIVSFVLYEKGYRWRGLAMMPLLFETLSRLQGLMIDVKNKSNTVYLKFL